MTPKENLYNYPVKILVIGTLKSSPDKLGSCLCVDKNGVKKALESFDESRIFFLKEASETTLLDIKNELR